MPQTTAADVIIIGAGIAGIATAHYLTCKEPARKVVLVDALLPMSLTSAQSGENYRNWWPHQVMTDFIDRSIDLLEGIAGDSSNRINLTHRGYALATRQDDISELINGLHTGYGTNAADLIRIRDGRDAASYLASLSEKHTGVDVITDPGTIRRAFPAFDPEIRRVIHIRRAGDLDSYQLTIAGAKCIAAEADIRGCAGGHTEGATVCGGSRSTAHRLVRGRARPACR